MDAIIRPARPEDGTAVAGITYMAGRGHTRTSIYDLMITGPPGPTPERLAVLEGLFAAEARSMFHHSFYLVAEVGGTVAASLCTYSRRRAGGRKTIEALKETGWTNADLESMSERLEPYLSVEPRAPRDSLIVENVGAFREFRGRGIVHALLERALESARADGFTEAQLACFIGNTKAEEAYERVGFRVTETLTDKAFEKVFGCPGMSRMVMELLTVRARASR